MLEIREDKYFYIPSIDGNLLIPIELKDSVSADVENFAKEPAFNKKYKIQNNLFIEDKNGDWKCSSISWSNNREKNWWQFWLSSRIYDKIDMERVK